MLQFSWDTWYFKTLMCFKADSILRVYNVITLVLMDNIFNTFLFTPKYCIGGGAGGPGGAFPDFSRLFQKFIFKQPIFCKDYFHKKSFSTCVKILNFDHRIMYFKRFSLSKSDGPGLLSIVKVGSECFSLIRSWCRLSKVFFLPRAGSFTLNQIQKEHTGPMKQPID